MSCQEIFESDIDDFRGLLVATKGTHQVLGCSAIAIEVGRMMADDLFGIMKRGFGVLTRTKKIISRNEQS
jgi:hypothetical protein